MKHERMQARLGEYLDGELAPPGRREMEEHLDGCDGCRDELEGLRTLRERARSLPRDIQPPSDLWPAIAARLDSPRVIPIHRAPPSRWLGPAWLAAAAAVLMLFASGATAWWLRGPAAAPPAAADRPGPPQRAVPALVAFRPAEAEYVLTATELQDILEARRETLSPETIATLETNLRIIDRAIGEARAALEADPRSGPLTEMLSTVYRQKIDLLEQAVQLSSRI